MRTGSGLTAAAELGTLLRSRRAGLNPEDVGLSAGRRRRTPGLRREEVAQLAAISPTYYALIERGRAANPSRQVIDALATALRLSPPERDYLHTLAAGDTTPPAQAAPGEILAPGVADLVARLDPYPAYVTGQRWDVLSANRAARELWTDWPAVPEPDRNMLIWTFNAPQAREVFIEWDSEAQALLGRFRAAAARHLGDPGFTELIDRLHATSPEVRAWWNRHHIAPLGGGTKRLRHPQLGEMDLQHVVLQVVDNPEHKLVTFTPSPDDTERIAALIAGRRPGTTGNPQPSDPC
jgi:transcriptional regulator with XRE-family HTH domain